MKEKIKDVLIRALKTFWQAALAALAVTMPQTVESISNGASRDVWINALISVGTGALAAGFSAVYNGVVKPLISSGKTAGNSTADADTPDAGTVSTVPTATEPAETIPTGKEPTGAAATVASPTVVSPDASAICDKPEVT